MEHSHVGRMRDRGLRDALAVTTIVCLDIRDEYEYMDPDLVDAFVAALPAHVANLD